MILYKYDNTNIKIIKEERRQKNNYNVKIYIIYMYDKNII